VSTLLETDALSQAIRYIGAEQVRPAHVALYAHYDHGTHRYYIVTEHDLATLGGALALLIPTTHADVYSRWCAHTPAAEMPRWWTPERQYAYRALNSFGQWEVVSFTAGHDLQRITADLETGAEVPV
jgi:hypothetical protein